jgi:V/A-type H+-transporting ATPase subunit K
MGAKREYWARVLMLTLLLAAFCLTTGVGVGVSLGQATPGGPLAADVSAMSTDQPAGATRWDLGFAIAVSIGMPCLAAGYAVGKIGAAALGAASERPELLTRSLLFVALAEGIAIYGLLTALLVLFLKF